MDLVVHNADIGAHCVWDPAPKMLNACVCVCVFCVCWILVIRPKCKPTSNPSTSNSGFGSRPQCNESQTHARITLNPSHLFASHNFSMPIVFCVCVAYRANRSFFLLVLLSAVLFGCMFCLFFNFSKFSILREPRWLEREGEEGATILHTHTSTTTTTAENLCVSVYAKIIIRNKYGIRGIWKVGS